jgi:hypothetical protein
MAMNDVSFHYTQAQYRSGEKDLTRRVKWRVKPGDQFRGVEKMQGIKKGEHRIPLGVSLCLSVEEEPLNEIVKRPYRFDRIPILGEWEVVREGFPAFQGKEEKFVDMFCQINKGLHEDSIIKRVCFRRVFS